MKGRHRIAKRKRNAYASLSYYNARGFLSLLLKEVQCLLQPPPFYNARGFLPLLLKKVQCLIAVQGHSAHLHADLFPYGCKDFFMFFLAFLGFS